MSEVRRILLAVLPGSSRNVARRLVNCEKIEVIIQTRWQVNPWSWRLKHLQWFIDVHARDWSPRMRYQVWRDIRAILAGVGKPHLVQWLANRNNANYLRPDGTLGRLSRRGRPPLLAGRKPSR